GEDLLDRALAAPDVHLAADRLEVVLEAAAPRECEHRRACRDEPRAARSETRVKYPFHIGSLIPHAGSVLRDGRIAPLTRRDRAQTCRGAGTRPPAAPPRARPACRCGSHRARCA